MGCPIKGTKMSQSDTVTITPVKSSHSALQTFLANIINILKDWLVVSDI